MIKKSLITTSLLFNIYSFADCKQNIHLTFDDGPLLGKTNKVFNALEKHRVKATFFVNTHYVNSGQANLNNDEKMLYSPIAGAANNIRENKKRRWLLKRLKDAGHKIGSHGFGHYSYKKRDPAYPGMSLNSDKQKRRNIEISSKILKGFMSEPYIFRLPYGKPFRGSDDAQRKRVNNQLSSAYDLNVGWKTDSRDWESESKYNKLKGNAKERFRKKFIMDSADKLCSTGGITVFHDIKNITGDTLDEIMAEVKRRGGKFVDFNQALHDPQQERALEKLTTTGEKVCDAPQRSLQISRKSEKLSKVVMGDIIESTYKYVANVYATYNQAANAVSSYSIGSKCLAHANQYGDYEVRCRNIPQRVLNLDPRDYPKNIGSFQNITYARNALDKALAQGKDCEIIPVINSQGIPFNRVACR